MIQLPVSDPRLLYDKTPIPEERVSSYEVDDLRERMYQHACARCRDDAQRREQEPVAPWQLVQWGILTEDRGSYYPTYAWKLLTGDTEWLLPDAYLQMARFQGDTRAYFLDRKEARGPIDQQIEDAVIFVKWHINLGAWVDGAYQEDCYELPMDGVRELITNAVLHRVYWSRGAIQVAVYDDRLEITSPGGLYPSQTKDRLLAGCPLIQNSAIAAAFRYMHLVEGMGTGLPRAFAETRRYGLREPVLEDIGTSFRISLRRKPVGEDPDSAQAISAAKETDQEQIARLQRENSALRRRVQELERVLRRIRGEAANVHL